MKITERGQELLEHKLLVTYQIQNRERVDAGLLASPVTERKSGRRGAEPRRGVRVSVSFLRAGDSGA